LSNFEHEKWFEVLQQPDKLHSVDSLLAFLALQQRLEYGTVVGSLRAESILVEDVLAHRRIGFPPCLPHVLDDDVAEDEEVVYATFEDDEDEGYDDEEEMRGEEEMDHPGRMNR